MADTPSTMGEGVGPMKIKTLLVDDSREFLDEEQRWLAGEPTLVLLGQAETAKEAFDFLDAAPIDLVLLDLKLPDMDGLSALRQIKARPEPPKVIVVTLHDDVEYRREALSAGADGFVLKRHLAPRLIPEVRTLFGLAG
jgi:DNA-binding NarL/FixJ family response regulator